MLLRQLDVTLAGGKKQQPFDTVTAADSKHPPLLIALHTLKALSNVILASGVPF